ncbi:hypothetical protein [Streptosporangium sp. NPDC006007]|uniref:hypothetical protein n=1 Tax=Streptosporangium sp. NPDC006007 TaxID=3154575 RepID=UPI0033BDB70B
MPAPDTPTPSHNPDLTPDPSSGSGLGPGSADTARNLEARNPGWAILWRPWARRYWAFPCWITTHPEPIETRNPHDLINLIQQTELHHPPPGGPRHPPPYQHNQRPTG